MGKKVTEAPKVVTQMPNLETVFQELLDAIRADVDALRSRMPPGSEGLADKIIAVVQEAISSLSPTTLKAALLADILNLLREGKGPAPHDPTELA